MQGLSATKTGKLREKCAEILSETFPDWDVSAQDIIPVTGFWKRVDVYRWQAVFHLKKRFSNGDRIPMTVGCWETLVDFVRQAKKTGISFENNEVWANEI